METGIESRLKNIEEKLNKLHSLEKDVEAIALTIRKLTIYGADDHETALIYARKSAESICLDVYKREKGIKGNAKLTLDPLIQELKKLDVLPDKVETHLRTIQMYGNRGAHAGYVIEKEELETVLGALPVLVNWYFEDYLKVSQTPTANLSPLILNESRIIEEQRKEEQIKEIIQKEDQDFWELAKESYEGESFEECLYFCNKAIKKRQGDLDVFILRTKCYWILGMREKANTDIEEILKQNSFHEEALELKLQFLISLGKQESLRFLLDLDATSLRSLFLLQFIATYLLLLMEYSKARNIAERILTSEPENPLALFIQLEAKRKTGIFEYDSEFQILNQYFLFRKKASDLQKLMDGDIQMFTLSEGILQIAQNYNKENILVDLGEKSKDVVDQANEFRKKGDFKATLELLKNETSDVAQRIRYFAEKKITEF